MAASAKKKNKKGKTISLTDFLAEDGGTGGGSTYVPKPVSWADETDDLEGDVSTTCIVMMMTCIGHLQLTVPSCPLLHGLLGKPNIDRSRLPKSPPYTAFLGNLPYDVTEDSIKEFFRGLNISAVRLPREPSNPERLKGFGYAEFEDLDSLFTALSLNEESLGNRRIRVDVADQAQDKDRDDRSFGRDRNRDSDKTDTDWRARPATDSFDDYPPRRGDDSFGDKYRDRYDSDRYRDGYRDSYRDGPRRDMDRYGGRDRYDDRGSRDYDRGYDSRIGSGRRAFGSGYRRDDDYRGGGDRYEDRYERRDDRSWSSRDDYSRDDYRRDDRGPPQRPKLNLKPRSTPKEDDSSASTSQSSRAASIFGGAKPVDTAAREREVEERLQKEQEKLQRQLDEPKLERRPRERHPSWRSEETQERSRTGSESSQTGTSSTSGRNARRRESEKSLENETPNKEEDCQSPTSKPPKPEQPLKVMPAPPPKENAWVKRSSNPPARSQSSDTEQQSPTSGGGKVVPAQPSEEGPVRKADENKVDGVSAPKGQSGNSSRGPGDGGNKDLWKESDRKDGKKDQDSRSAPEPKKAEDPASKFSSASKYAALAVDGEDENEGEDYTE
ncbi:eukaryotic translation initiation factor 4B isoform X3 [Tursiops truncatus]|uniref:Eukaryotic translation initiation factor 4B n=1 Tax=Tursiops truncatus TaxID=9739 RepID=A0A2U4CBH0_TURTR|nr:eukaryotic translation initiation factor 4B isoform X3 [Tursiops truncatus]